MIIETRYERRKGQEAMVVSLSVRVNMIWGLLFYRCKNNNEKGGESFKILKIKKKVTEKIIIRFNVLHIKEKGLVCSCVGS